jgi:hypothetical protein
MGYMVDLGSGTHSIIIPADKQLAPNRTYYWGVRGVNKEENGETIAGLWPFTTGGTPPPPPHFASVTVRSDNRSGGLRWNLLATVRGPSPADITELKVTGPGDFQYIFTEDDINQNEQSGLYRYHDVINPPSPLSNGTYTFSVTDSQGRTVEATADFTATAEPVPIVSSGMAPADLTYVNSTTPTFSWGSVGEGYYYRIQIFDWNSLERNVYISDYSQELQATVPEGYLLENSPYKWRVEAYDPTLQNRSCTDVLRFSTGSLGYDLEFSYGYVWADNSHYGGQRKSINTGVLGPLPTHIHTSPGILTVTGPGGSGFSHTFTGGEVMHSVTPGTPYSYGEPGFPATGSYTFTVQDINGDSDTLLKNVTSVSEIPIVDQATMSPANNAYLTNRTPTFSWAAVLGSPRYYRIVINDWSLRYTVYSSTRSAATSATIPSGILEFGRSYKWRVEVFDASGGAAANSRSTSAWNCFTTPGRPRHTDFDGDGKTDVAVYDVANGWWYLHNSEDGGYVFDAIGVGGGSQWKPVSGDYDGDGKSDVAVYDADYGWWLFHYTAGGYFYDHIGVGGTGYTAVPGNYDGDGVTDIAVYNGTNGDWYIKYSSGGYGFDNLGGTGSIPLPADYDGDGKTDVAVYDVANGWWYLHYSSDGSYVFDAIGVGGGSQWRPVPGDYDGDRKADVAVYDAQNGWWLFHYTAGGYFYDHIGVGGTGYGGVPGDYDGDGVTDIAVYNQTNGYWYVKYSSGGYGFDSLGGPGSVPVNLPYLLGSAF